MTDVPSQAEESKSVALSQATFDGAQRRDEGMRLEKSWAKQDGYAGRKIWTCTKALNSWGLHFPILSTMTLTKRKAGRKQGRGMIIPICAYRHLIFLPVGGSAFPFTDTDALSDC